MAAVDPQDVRRKVLQQLIKQVAHPVVEIHVLSFARLLLHTVSGYGETHFKELSRSLVTLFQTLGGQVNAAQHDECRGHAGWQIKAVSKQSYQ